MESARLKKSLSVVCGCALLLGVVGTGASAGASSTAVRQHFTTVGSAAASIDDNGNFAATVDGTDSKAAISSTTDVTGVLAENSGIGVRTLKGKGKTDASGNFSLDIVSPRDPASGLATGKIFEDTARAATLKPSNIKVTVTCTITYPPLSASCTVTISA